MARYAIIENTLVVNIIVADADFIAQNKPDAIECPQWIGVGDKYENENFSRVTHVLVEDVALNLEPEVTND
jgi:hypothetical protein